MKKTNKLAHPLFLFSLFLLVLNDWYLKPVFHNEITGKLSDFTGLFAFPFFLGAIFPKYKKSLHFITFIGFLYWNSLLSQPLIDLVNQFGIPIGRTVDVTDNIALISTLLSYQLLESPPKYAFGPIAKKLIMTAACLAFMATSISPHENRKFVNINKEYEFDFSKRELVSRLNMIQLDEVRRLNKYSGTIDFNEDTNVFHYNDSKDTLALILDYNKISDQDTIIFRTSFAEIQISGNDSISRLRLISTYKYVKALSDKDYTNKAIKQFEKRIVKKIRKFR